MRAGEHTIDTRFTRWIPCELFEKADAPAGRRLRIRGIISSEHPDTDDDRVLQAGLDFRPFMDSGVLNDGHDPKTSRVLGVPERIYPVTIPDEKGRPTRATAMEGYLLDDDEGRAIYNKAMALRKAGGQRRFGFSVEGAILKRDESDRRIVTQGIVTEVAVSRRPKNLWTSLDPLEKSLDRAFEGFLMKGMTAGSGKPAIGIPQTGSVAGLMPESLEGVPTRFLVYADPLAADPSKLEPLYRASYCEGATMKKSEALAFIRSRLPGATPDQQERIYAMASQLGGC